MKESDSLGEGVDFDITPEDVTMERVIDEARRVVRRYEEKLRNAKANRSGPVTAHDIGPEIWRLRHLIDVYEHGGTPVRRAAYENTVGRRAGSSHAPLESRETHESFGMVSFGRVQGAARLFGTSIPRHDGFIELTVRRAERNFSYGRQTFYGDRVPLVRVWMSVAQFAEAITSLNVGDGVPCTLRSMGMVDFDQVPEMMTEHALVEQELVDKFNDRTDALREAIDELSAYAEGRSSVSKARLRDVVKAAEFALRTFTESTPHALKNFHEAAERVVSQAKTEIDAAIGRHIQRGPAVSAAPSFDWIVGEVRVEAEE